MSYVSARQNVTRGLGDVKKLEELDALRGMMALWVAISHVCFFAGLKSDGGIMGLLSHAGGAVSVFVILSGFAITSSLMNSRATYGQYMARRFWRLAPVFLIALLLGVLTSDLYLSVFSDVPWIPAEDSVRIVARANAEHEHFALNIALHLLGMHGAVPDTWLYGSSLAFNAPLWSLSLEWQFYLVAPIIVAAIAAPKKHPLALGIVLVVALVGRDLFNPYFPQVPSFLPMALTFFLIGIGTAVYLPALQNNWKVTLCAVACALVACKLAGMQRYVAPLLVWTATLGIALAPSTGTTGIVQRMIRMPFLIKFGERSYGFYAYHLPIMLAAAAWLASEGYAYSPIAFATLLSATLIVSGLLARLSYDLMEVHVNAWAKRRFRAAQPEAPVPESVEEADSGAPQLTA